VVDVDDAESLPNPNPANNSAKSLGTLSRPWFPTVNWVNFTNNSLDASSSSSCVSGTDISSFTAIEVSCFDLVVVLFEKNGLEVSGLMVECAIVLIVVLAVMIYSFVLGDSVGEKFAVKSLPDLFLDTCKLSS